MKKKLHIESLSREAVQHQGPKKVETAVDSILSAYDDDDDAPIPGESASKPGTAASAVAVAASSSSSAAVTGSAVAAASFVGNTAHVNSTAGTWRECVDPITSATYYWSVATGEVTWSRPAELDLPQQQQFQQTPASASATAAAITPSVAAVAPLTNEALKSFLSELEELQEGKVMSNLFRDTCASSGNISWQPYASWNSLDRAEKRELVSQVEDAFHLLSASPLLDILQARYEDLQAEGGCSVELFKLRLTEMLERHKVLVAVAERNRTTATAAALEVVKAEEKVSVKLEQESHSQIEPTSEEIQSKEEEEKGEAILASLPKGNGFILPDSLLLFCYPEEEATVAMIQAQFLDREVVTIRILGSGFGAVTFSDEEEAELAQNVECPPPDKRSWVITAEGFYTRFATDEDQITSYPISFPEGAEAVGNEPMENNEVQDMDTSDDIRVPVIRKEEKAPKVQIDARNEAYFAQIHAQQMSENEIAEKGEKKKVLTSRIKNSKVNQQLMRWKAVQSKDEQKLEASERKAVQSSEAEERKNSTDEWHRQQISSGGDSRNPNFVPLGQRKRSSDEAAAEISASRPSVNWREKMKKK